MWSHRRRAQARVLPSGIQCRRSPLLPALALALAFAPDTARATTCAPPPYENVRGLPLSSHIEVPIDARPWTLIVCEEVDLEQPFECVLTGPVSGTIPLALDDSRLDECDFEAGAFRPYTIARLIPEEPMRPDAEYLVHCSSDPLGIAGLFVNTAPSTAPSLPPPPLDATFEITYRGGCCGGVRQDLEVTLHGVDAAFLAEGGLIEAQTADGQRFLVSDRDLGDDTDTNNAFLLPRIDGDVVLTPFGADGAEGESVVLRRDERGDELVATPCSIHDRSELALWLALPLLLLGARRRRPA